MDWVDREVGDAIRDALRALERGEGGAGILTCEQRAADGPYGGVRC